MANPGTKPCEELHPSDDRIAIARLCDPFPQDWLMRRVDPAWGTAASRSSASAWRIFAAWAFMVLPTVVFCSIPSPTTGGNLLGANGYLMNAHMVVQAVIWGIWLWMFTAIRRVLADAVCHIKRTGVLDGIPLSSKLAGTLRTAPRLLRLLASACSPNAKLAWLVLIAVLNLRLFVNRMRLDTETWSASRFDPDSPLSFLNNGAYQANLAGFWHFVVASALGGYLILLIGCAYVHFACLLHAIGRSKKLSIIPTHPDSTGGLLPIGRVALFLSLFLLCAGLYLMVLTIPVLNKTSAPTEMFFIVWSAYLILGPIAFFLPLLALRSAMLTARNEALIEIEKRIVMTELERRKPPSSDSGPKVDKGSSEEAMKALESRYNVVSAMSVWPLDRATLLKFTGSYVAPILGTLSAKFTGPIAVWLGLTAGS